MAVLRGSADAQTIPELAAAKPQQPVVRGRLTEIPHATLEELTAGAELVLDATIRKLRSYLTPDQEHILTDYNLIPNRVFAGRLEVEHPTPGVTAPAILSMYGGQLTIDGVTVAVIDHTVKVPEDGGRYLLFLERFREPGRYQLYRSGAFRIEDNRLTMMLTRHNDAYKEIAGRSFHDVVTRITAIVSSPRKP